MSPESARGHYRIALVCLGNICRSPMADVVLNDRLAAAGLGEAVSADSYGTGDWHVGGPMDDRAAERLRRSGYDPSEHRARQAGHQLSDYDLVLAMDRANHADLVGLGVAPDRLRLFRDFDPQPGDGEVPDPYYGGADGFDDVLAMVERTADAIVDHLRASLAQGAER